MTTAVLLPVLGSLGAAGGTLALVWSLWGVRDRPGATWLVATLCVQFVLTAGYGLGYLVFDPTLRLAVEMLFWVCYVWLGALFLAFGLAYTGRGHVVRSPFFGAVVAGAVALTALVVTNPLHGLVWTGFRVLPPPGPATVAFTRESGALLILGVSALGAAVGTLLLVDTIVSYGRLYRRAALAVAVSPLPPGVGFALWTFGVAPAPGLNVAPVLFLLHVGIDAYAFLGSGLFEFHPATRRAGNRAAIADLGSPVVVVDERERVVNHNAAAASAFDLDGQAALGRPFADCYAGETVDPTAAEQDAAIRVDGAVRTFKVASTELEGDAGAHLGYTLVFQDITAERRREQRLAVLNRVLRHNLRNDLTVVGLALDEAVGRVDDDLDTLLGTAREKTRGLVDLSEKARTFERVVDDGSDATVSVPAVVEAAVADLREAYPDADVRVEADDATATLGEGLLRVVVTNLVENALEHGRAGDGAATDPGPDVTVTVTAADGDVTLTVRDRGPGIPDHERDAVLSGDESALEHGSGLGLWLVKWGVVAAGGDLALAADNGTTATVTLPRADATAARG